MSAYDQTTALLKNNPAKWLVTGVAGFIGSNILEALLELGQTVVGLDNFSTGHRANLEDVKNRVGETAWQRFRFHEWNICELQSCRLAVEGIDYVLHQAALGSVPRSINDPISTNRHNLDGFLNMLVAARDAEVKRFVYAASSSTYGDHPALPKTEDNIGRPLSPYAVTKYANELYADVFSRTYDMQTIGLRYFNVFGPRQDPNGAYAAVIPRWIGELLRGRTCHIYGDGDTSRDFCYIKNTIQVNLLAAIVDKPEAINQVYNVAVGGRTSLNKLYFEIRKLLGTHDEEINSIEPEYNDFRPGDVRHSQANISKAASLLGYRPTHDLEQGLRETTSWFLEKHLMTNGT